MCWGTSRVVIAGEEGRTAKRTMQTSSSVWPRSNLGCPSLILAETAHRLPWLGHQGWWLHARLGRSVASSCGALLHGACFIMLYLPWRVSTPCGAPARPAAPKCPPTPSCPEMPQCRSPRHLATVSDHGVGARGLAVAEKEVREEVHPELHLSCTPCRR